MDLNSTDCNVLIYDDEAAVYQAALQQKFPNITFHAAQPGADNERLFQSCDVLISFSMSLDEQMLNSAKKLKWLQALSAGTDRLEVLLKSRPDVMLTSVSGIHGPFLSEMVVFQMLSLIRQGKALHRQQEQKVWNRLSGSLLHGKRAMVVGTGASGEKIRSVCSAFGMNVLAASRTPRQVPYAEKCVALADLHKHMADVDFLILVLALSEDTRNQINHAVLSAMKPGSYVVNVARGGVLDEEALLQELDNGRIAGAALDVFGTEPLPADSPFWSHPRVLVTPHIAGLIDEYAEHALPVLEKNLEAYADGKIEQMINRVARHTDLLV